MNSDTSSQNHFDLPPPSAESQLPASAETAMPPVEQMMAPSPEASVQHAPAMSAAFAPQNDPMQPILPLDDSPIAQPAPVPATDAAAAGLSSTTALDKEWIQKAKQIVMQTANDPYEQNKQLAYVKADYLQKRYGKTVKVAE